MKNLSFIGLLLLIISALLFYFTTNFEVEKIGLSHFMGIVGGVGLGLIIGGIVGYVSKGTAVKAEKKKKDLVQLHKEKQELEQQAADLAQQGIKETKDMYTNNPLN